MESIGVVNVATNLISKVGVEIEVLITSRDVETTSMLWLGLTDDSYVVRSHGAVIIYIGKLVHTRECLLASRKLVSLGASCRIVAGCIVWNAILQCPYTIGAYVEVINSVEAQ